MIGPELHRDPVNFYRPAARSPGFLRGIRPIVQLTTPDRNEYPLPDPRYIAIHAACTRVAHLSCVAEYIEMIFRKMEDAEVLANDGGSGDVLYRALIRSTDIEP